MRCNNRVSCRSRRLKCPYDFYKYNIAVFRTNKKMDKIIVFVIFIYYASENVSATVADPLVSKYGNLVFSTLVRIRFVFSIKLFTCLMVHREL